jgi:hypothetical protein
MNLKSRSIFFKCEVFYEAPPSSDKLREVTVEETIIEKLPYTRLG